LAQSGEQGCVIAIQSVDDYLYVYSHILDDDGGIISAQPDVDHPHDISVTYAIYAIIGQLGIAIPPIVAVTGRRRC
jgi:hypothetical protein